MKEKLYVRNLALTLLLGIALGVCTVVKAYVPSIILPELDIPNMVLLSLAALLVDHYVTGGTGCCMIGTLIGAALSFGVLPFAAGFAVWNEALKLAVIGGITFALTAWLFTSVQDRLSSGPVAKAAPVFSAVGLYLAAQCFSGMIL